MTPRDAWVQMIETSGCIKTGQIICFHVDGKAECFMNDQTEHTETFNKSEFLKRFKGAEFEAVE